jgi:tetratricopeptide (TPR) repeat protein
MLMDWTYRNGGEYLSLEQEALGNFARALELEHDDAEVYEKRGVLHQVRGRWAEALEDYEMALKLEPAREPALRKQIALCQEKLRGNSF